MLRAERLIRLLPRRPNPCATGRNRAMSVMTAIAAAEIVTATATVGIAIATCVVMVHAMGRAATAGRAAIVRARIIAIPEAMHLGQNRRFGKTNLLGKSNLLGRSKLPGKSNLLGKIKRLAQINRRGKIPCLVRNKHRGPISRRAQISLATKASARLTIGASAVSEADEAVAGGGVVAGATAAKAMRMAAAPTQVQAQTQAPEAALPKAKRTWAASERQPPLLSSPKHRHSAIRLHHRPCNRPQRHRRRTHRRYEAPSRRQPAQDRTANMSCGPQPRAMFSARDPRRDSVAIAI